jgi:hypothetical protein
MKHPMEPQWNHDGRAKSGRMNGRWKVLFGRWKGDGIVVVAEPTSACVSSRLVRSTRWLGRRSRLDRRACATQAEACASMSAPACGACGDDGGGLCAISIRWRRASRQTRLCRRGAKSLLRREPNIPADLLVMRHCVTACTLARVITRRSQRGPLDSAPRGLAGILESVSVACRSHKNRCWQ